MANLKLKKSWHLFTISMTIEEYLAPLQGLSYDEYTGTNKATETRIIMDIKSELRRTSNIEEDVF